MFVLAQCTHSHRNIFRECLINAMLFADPDFDSLQLSGGFSWLGPLSGGAFLLSVP